MLPALITDRALTEARSLSPAQFFDGSIPYTPRGGFTTESLFNRVWAPEALLGMAHYCGYLTYEYPRRAEHRDRLVAPNDATRAMFMNAVLGSLPGAYRQEFEARVAQGARRARALRDVYESYDARRVPAAE
jgi:hypothetical protein